MQGCRAAPWRMHRPKSIPFLRFVLIIFFPEVLTVDKMSGTDRQTDRQNNPQSGDMTGLHIDTEIVTCTIGVRVKGINGLPLN